jgi:hypothetical protein
MISLLNFLDDLQAFKAATVNYPEATATCRDKIFEVIAGVIDRGATETRPYQTIDEVSPRLVNAIHSDDQLMPVAIKVC